ncbi:MAG: hypothetical protein NZ519_08610 [Bacteroidia bacterium]|nr:hypothetical protein [Bacteroidia bacterium]
MRWIMIVILLCSKLSCQEPYKRIGADLTLKHHPILASYRNGNFKIELHDSDILLQRKFWGRRYEELYILSHQKTQYTVDSLILFEVDNGQSFKRIVFPRTPSALTPLMNAYYDKNTPRVYANTTVERLNYLKLNYAQKTWVTELDTNLCPDSWKKTLLGYKLFIDKRS